MKKILFTCFLALPCLPVTIGIGSTSLLSLVAQSPGADLLHRFGGPNRGGDSRSDTFLADNFGLIPIDQDRKVGMAVESLHSTSVPVFSSQVYSERGIKPRSTEAESLASCVFCLMSSNGLVDKHLDLGAGEGGYALNPAPVTVFFDPEHQVSEAMGKELSAEVPVSGASRQEHINGGSSEVPGRWTDSTSSVIDSSVSNTINLLFETNLPDSILPRLVLSERELDPKFGYESRREMDVPLIQGTLAEGSPGYKKGLVTIPLEVKFGKFSLSAGENQIFKDLWLQQGDSLAVRFDSKSGKTLIWGPEATSVNLQLTLQRLVDEVQVQRNPVMILSDSLALLDSDGERMARQRALENYQPGWTRKMELLQTEAQKLNRAKQLFQEAGHSHPVWQALLNAESSLDPELFTWLKAYWIGKLRKGAYEFVRIANPNSSAWGELLLANSLDKNELDQFDQWEFAPQELVETLYLAHLLTAKLIPLGFMDWSQTLPGSLRDQVNALYLIREYKGLENPDELFQRAMAQTSSPLIGEYLAELFRSNLKGRPFANLPLSDQSGNPVYPESWKGKLVLLDFWLTGCGACLSFAQDQFFPLVNALSDHPDLLFVTVSGDTKNETWINSLKGGRYTLPESLNLFSGGPENPLLKRYQIRAFPAQILIDAEGTILQTGNFPQTYEGWKQLLESYLPANSTATPQPSPTHPNL
ncbi:TlpA family protein disulfide reductase [Algoriphagus lacus]|nr:TlpA disulfide reductase family protein [Algoriphagus lacus]